MLYLKEGNTKHGDEKKIFTSDKVIVCKKKTNPSQQNKFFIQYAISTCLKLMSNECSVSLKFASFS